MKLTTFFISGNNKYFWKYIQNIGDNTLDTLRNFTFISSYLQTKTFARKRDVNQGHFRKSLQASTNAMKNNYPKTAHTFFTSCLIFTYLYANCCNFRTALL